MVAAIGALGFAAPAANAAATPCEPQAKACVQLSTGKAWLQDGGNVTRGPVPMAPGLPSYPTPKGKFHVQYKDIDHYSRQYNGPMPYSVFFTTTGVAFHEGSLRQKSHGCVHLSHQDAVAFYNALHTGDEVQVVA
ncbi:MULTISPECIES: L,D-transpeptidase [Amycolatopsis]|uniref:L,D-transpeptidase catalytic domain n=2 Tax=Amycolatopsis TaxID=1813 RepID=A0A1I4DSZ4_9PSEU|nr:L,D-transpeptidase [Amycolatopsis sacchari]SFK96742.1 L,D-transpeptidase catalytic domain [Amycolatopsis sacchari]